MFAIPNALKENRFRIVLGALAAIGLLLFAAIPLLQPKANWVSAFSILASELVASALVLTIVFRQQLGSHWDNPRTDETIDERDTRWTRNTVAYFGFLGLLVILILSLSVSQPESLRDAARVFGLTSLYAGAFFCVGALIGFLFGIPRSLQSKGVPKPDSTDQGDGNGTSGSSGASAMYTPNTNLEEISDWLTKIIVGLGLINLKTIPGQLKSLAWYFSQFCDTRVCESVALALILYFFTCGFFLAYLMTRLFLTGAFSRADRAAAFERQKRKSEIKSQVGDLMQEALTSAFSDRGSDIQPLLERQALAAQAIANIAGTTNKPTFEKELQDLSRRYDSLRQGMKASDERTRQMEAIAAGMRGYALTSYDLLPRFLASPGPGERLVAVSFLEVKPNCAYVDWLATRFVEDKPFLQYHAAVALREAARKLRDICGDSILAAIQRATNLLGTDKQGTDRLNMLQQALSEVSLPH